MKEASIAAMYVSSREVDKDDGKFVTIHFRTKLENDQRIFTWKGMQETEPPLEELKEQLYDGWKRDVFDRTHAQHDASLQKYIS